MRRIGLAVLLLGFAPACIVEAPGREKNSPEQARAVMAQAPALQIQNGANLENKIEIVGTIIQPGRVAPGETLRVQAFFKVLEEIDTDYTIFVHVEDSEGRAERLNADHKPAGGVYPTNRWKKGETVKDEFSIYVPPAMQVRGLNLYLGFWDPNTDQRMRLTNADKVKSDGNNRILVAQVTVGS